jgi:hypothetical protein
LPESPPDDEEEELSTENSKDQSIAKQEQLDLAGLFYTIYGIQLEDPGLNLHFPVDILDAKLPHHSYFKKDPDTKIPQLSRDFFQSYTDQLYQAYIDEMLNISKPGALSFQKRIPQ